MIVKKIPPWVAVLLILLVIITVALWLRVALPYNQVFAGDWVKLTGVDAYYYMRLVDNLAAHFPQLTQFDPYLKYPGGWTTGGSPDFFAYFMGAIVWIVGLGKADQHMVDVIAVYIPPLLAVLTILAVFFTGRALGSSWLGLLAAGLLAILPGEFLGRSLLGYTDHHVAEVLFSSGLMTFVFLAIKESEGKRLGEMARGGWKGIGRPVIYGLLGGVFLWLYMLTWAGALLFALILFIFVVAQAVLDHLHGRPLDYLGILGACLFGASLALYLPRMGNLMTVAALAAGLLVSLLLPVVSRMFNQRKMGPWTFPLFIMGMGIAAVAALAISGPAMLQGMLDSLGYMFLWHTGATVSEEQPLLIYRGQFTLLVATAYFFLAFFFSLICIVVLLYQVIKKGQPDRTLLLVWSVVILLSTLAMRRSAYYYAVNVALLTGYLCWIPLSMLLRAKKAAARSRRGSGQLREGAGTKRNTGFAALLLAIMALLVYYPNIGPLPNGQKPAIDMAMHPSRAPSDAWCESMDWLRANTPEPFGTPEAYYGLHKPVNTAGGFEYPPGAYGVLAWWDGGYRVARMGHRAPAANPGEAPTINPGDAPAAGTGTATLVSAAYFASQDGPSAAGVINTCGARYVIVDNEIADIDGKFHALATLSGSSPSKYYEEFLQKQGNQYVSMVLFYPQYYRSMVSRLYNFDGKAAVPDAAYVLACKEITVQGVRGVKEITEFKTFSSYGEAEAFMLAHKDKGYILVGQDPYKSCVPLEELKGYKLVYGSSRMVSTGSKPQSEVKIFEYDKDAVSPAVR